MNKKHTSTPPENPSTTQLQSGLGLETGHALLTALPDIWDEESIFNSLRLCPKGLFVAEDKWESFVEIFQSWYQDFSPQNKVLNRERAVRKLTGGDTLTVLYLIDGKRCLPGYWVPMDSEGNQKVKIPRATGITQDPRSALHVRDPSLKSQKGLDVQLDRNGLRILVEGKGKTFLFTTETALQSYTVFSLSKRVASRVPSIQSGVRELVVHLSDLMKQFRPLGGRGAFVPLRYSRELNKNRSLRLFSWGTIHLIGEEMEEDKYLVHFAYDLVGKSLRKFLSEEIDAARTEQRKPKGIHLYRSAGRSLGTVSLDGESVRIHTGAFQNYVSAGTASGLFTRFFRKKFDLLDILSDFASCFGESSWVRQEELPKSALMNIRGKALFRVKKPWVFCMKSRSELFDVVSLVSNQRQRNAAPRNNSKRRGQGKGAAR